jgi:hypothetical protein
MAYDWFDLSPDWQDRYVDFWGIRLPHILDWDRKDNLFAWHERIEPRETVGIVACMERHLEKDTIIPVADTTDRTFRYDKYYGDRHEWRQWNRASIVCLVGRGYNAAVEW